MVLVGLVLLLLIFPIQYSLRWQRKSFDDFHWLQLQVAVLLGLIRFRLVLQNTQMHTSFIIFGIQKPLKKTEKKDKKHKKEKKAPKQKKKSKPILAKVQRIKRYFSLSDLKRIFTLVLKHLIIWLKPSSLKGEFHVGTGNPAYTGIIYGWYCTTPLFDSQSVKVTPEFVHSGICGEGSIRGMFVLIELLVRIIFIITIVFSIYMRKKMQQLFSKPRAKFVWRNEGGSNV